MGEESSLSFIRGERITAFRKEMKISQRELADMLDVSQNQISKYETGKAEPSTETLVKLCRTFNTTADYLLGLSERPKRSFTQDLPELEYEVLRRIHGRDEAFLQKLIAVLDIL